MATPDRRESTTADSAPTEHSTSKFPERRSQSSYKFAMIPPLPSSVGKENAHALTTASVNKNDRRPSQLVRPRAGSSSSHDLDQPHEKYATSAVRARASSPFSDAVPQLKCTTGNLDKAATPMADLLGKPGKPNPTPETGPLTKEYTVSSEKRYSRTSSIIGSGSGEKRILRHGERMESLFCFNQFHPGAPEMNQYKELCSQILDGDATDDAETWSRVLKMLCRTLPTEGSDRNSHSSIASNIIRLHRRATSRLSGQKNEHVLQIWLSYAKVQVRCDQPQDARLFIRHIQNQGLGEDSAEFYQTASEIELKLGNTQGAKDFLVQGIKRNASPIRILRERLDLLDGNMSKADSAQPRNDSIVVPSNQQSPHLRSPKRRKVDADNLNHCTTTNLPNGGDETENSNMSLGTVGTLMSMSDVNESKDSIQLSTSEGLIQPDDQKNSDTIDAAASHTARRVTVNVSASKAIMDPPPIMSKSVDGTKPGPREADVIRSSKLQANLRGTTFKTGISSVNKPPLRSKFGTKLSRSGKLGGPQRVDPSEWLNRSDSESEDEGMIDSSPTKTEVTEKQYNADLSYIYSWTPSKPKAKDGSNTVEGGNATAQSALDGPVSVCSSTGSAGEPETVPPNRFGVQKSSTADADNIHPIAASKAELQDDQNTKDSLRQRSLIDSSKASSRTEKESSVLKPKSHTSSLSSSRRTSQTEKERPGEESNSEFLPLVSESNIIHVNQTPYVKLGVIGRGGSCKVYRALSKDCNVVAIKKVKLSKMDKKAVDGYANEISLLKGLSGNRAIINLHDSEVALQRKAIYMVMELGEADLNHLLQQRALSSSKSGKGRSKLNLNFIRLTWQQMLSAVNVIHEARIVHGDLKPANFLFVRGELKLIDFGIAKAIQSDDTTNIYRDSQIGTLNYMSPEAIQADSGSSVTGMKMKIGRASDIWSLGCILYQMFYGKTPFADLHLIQKLHAIVNENHAIQFPGDIDKNALDAVKQCLQRKPELRPPIVGKNGLLTEHRFANS